jgi:pimeloyl-ACP methyl ester carboxylesterase
MKLVVSDVHFPDLAQTSRPHATHASFVLTPRAHRCDVVGVRRVAIVVTLLALILTAASCTRMVRPSRPYVPFTIDAGTWHGYPRHDFILRGRRCTVVTPQHVATGVPWVWRASFFDQRPEVEVALLDAGFHVVYVDVIDLCGSPDAVARWDDVYELLTQAHGFSPRPALTAISRGALIAYNWAAAHPDHVACIFADIPVCDFKSWPGGYGRGPGDADEWRQCLQAYGLDSASARRFAGNPVDTLEPLARAGVPLLHAHARADPLVPFDENTGLVADRYRTLGGEITVIEKPGASHAPGVDPPEPVIEFLRRCGAE